MLPRTPPALDTLYETDETAWMDLTAELVRTGRFDQIDATALAEFLNDMARRDRREVFNRLVVLLAHLLKWEHQPKRRSRSWRGTILVQQRKLRLLLDSGTLRNHAIEVFAKVYADAREQAVTETGLARADFPEVCPWDLDGALNDRGEHA